MCKQVQLRQVYLPFCLPYLSSSVHLPPRLCSFSRETPFAFELHPSPSQTSPLAFVNSPLHACLPLTLASTPSPFANMPPCLLNTPLAF
ncbi:hypothetical protein BD626DRAFT_483037 [Schizophyllum amplum]|uniref:Uncharacterized protein n=1 Tax=Schizophyllum amplum TaxID=97359 RepID=A0A550CP29_9AGAR|nr:hypothetical protein BD626DRAFT_483037 [Auriculariopsis ampla]